MYEYPTELYCDQCDRDVGPKIEERTTAYTNYVTGQEYAVPWKAAVCPLCGKTLCERDQDYAFVELLKRMKDPSQ